MLTVGAPRPVSTGRGYAAGVSPVNPVADAPLLHWLHPAPERLTAWLAEVGFEVTFGVPVPRLKLWPTLIEIRATTDTRDERLALVGSAPAPPVSRRHEHPNGINGVVAIGLASVDAERAIAELGSGHFQPAQPDEWLGARAWQGPPGRPRLIMLEPLTEGRLAAALARHGEGAVALYLVSSRPPAAGLARVLDRPRTWPGGAAARLVGVPARPWGPFLFVVDEMGG